jgi:hypothetical protein
MDPIGRASWYPSVVLLWGTAVALVFALFTACGGDVHESSSTGGAGLGGSTGNGGNPSVAGSSGALSGSGTGGSAGDGADGGSPGAGGTSGGSGTQQCFYGLPLPEEPCFTCEPLPAGSTDGCGPPPAMWGWDGSVADPTLMYPVGCTVYLPVENPFYPGGPQTCSCEAWMPDEGPAWTCGL